MPSIPEEQESIEHSLVNAFLENVPDLIYFKDRDSRFIAVSKSKARRHGCDNPAELRGKSDSDLFGPEHAIRAREDESAIMTSNQPILDKVERLIWTDGRVTWARTSKLPLRGENGEVIGTFGISEDITRARETEEALEKAQKELIDASRLAGMAEVATGVLHNVGNVLNSLNVSASVLATALKASKAASLAKVADLMKEHSAELGAFLTDDPKGKLIPDFLHSLSRHLAEEQATLLAEVESLQHNIDHIKEIVTMQQAYATMAGVVEPLAPASLMEDSLRMNAAALVRHDVTVVREFAEVPPVRAERGKVLQILINLIRNAKYAIDECPDSSRRLTLRVQPGRPGTVRLTVEDTGVGIPAENLSRLFTHGFTTRVQGHGFGLHSSLLAATDMGGTLTGDSSGHGTGAAFHLELPIAPPAPGSVRP